MFSQLDSDGYLCFLTRFLEQVFQLSASLLIATRSPFSSAAADADWRQGGRVADDTLAARRVQPSAGPRRTARNPAAGAGWLPKSTLHTDVLLEALRLINSVVLPVYSLNFFSSSFFLSFFFSSDGDDPHLHAGRDSADQPAAAGSLAAAPRRLGRQGAGAASKVNSDVRCDNHFPIIAL